VSGAGLWVIAVALSTGVAASPPARSSRAGAPDQAPLGAESESESETETESVSETETETESEAETESESVSESESESVSGTGAGTGIGGDTETDRFNVDRVAPFVMPNLTMPGRVTLDVVAGRSSPPVGRTRTLVSIELGGAYSIGRGLSVFGVLPVAHVRDDFVEETALGNISLGAMFVQDLQGRDSAWRFGGSVELLAPTAGSGGDDRLAATANSVFRRPVWARYLPSTPSVRLHAHARYESGALFVQGLFGADFVVFEDGVLDANGELLVEARIGVAAGAMLSPKLGVIAEITTVSDFLEDNGVAEDEFLHSLDVGVRYFTGLGTVGLRTYIPLDEQFRDEEMLGVAIDFTAPL